jgi:hypothetical protein
MPSRDQRFLVLKPTEPCGGWRGRFASTLGVLARVYRTCTGPKGEATPTTREGRDAESRNTIVTCLRSWFLWRWFCVTAVRV